MRRYLILIFATLISTASLSQTLAELPLTINESETFKTQHKKSTIISRHGDNDGGGYLVLSGGSNQTDYIIQHLSSDLRIDTEKSFDFDKERIVSSFLIGKTFHFITSVIDKTTEEIIFRTYYTDDKAQTFNQKIFLKTPIDSLGVKIGFAKFIDFFTPSFKTDSKDKDRNGFITFSENKNFFTISFDIPETKKDEHLIYVFDKGFNLINETTLDSGEIKDSKYNFVDIEVSDVDGTVYYLSKVITKKNIFGIRKYEFEILKITQESTNAFTFQKEGISYGTLRLKIDRFTNRLRAIGTYSEISDFYDKGIVMVTFDPENLETYQTKLSPFPDALIEQKYGNSKKKELKEYFIRDIVQRDNGNFVFISEELRVIDRRNEYGHVSSPYYFHFKDVLVAEISKEGAINWVQNVNKHQEITHWNTAALASFSGFLNDDNIYLVFNAKKVVDKKNKPNVFFSSSISPSRQYILKLDATGAMTYTEFKAENPKMLYATGDVMFSTEKNSNHLIISGSSLNKRRFLKMSLQKD